MTRAERAIRFSVVMVVVSLFLGFALFTFPVEKKSTGRLLDFSEFYAAGKIVRQGLGSHLYDLKLQAEVQLQDAALHAFYVRPPFEALLFVPFSFLSYRQAYGVWIILSLLLLAGACRLIERNSSILTALSQYAGGAQIDLGLFLIVFLGFPPTSEGLLIGQDSMLLLMVYTLVFIALRQKHEFKAGCLLACGLFKFHLVLPFVIIFLLRRRWSFLLGFSGVAALLVALSVFVSGPGVLLSYPGMFLKANYRALMGFQPEYAANIRGLVFLLGAGRFPRLSAGLVAALSALVLWLIAKNWKPEYSGLCFAAALVGALLTGYHLFVYDLCLLLLAAAVICADLAERKSLQKEKALTGVLLLLYMPPLHNFLINRQVYALLCVPMTVLLVVIGRIVKRANSQHLSTAKFALDDELNEDRLCA